MSLKPYPKYKDSGVPWLGDVPEHWSVESLRHCIGSIFNGLTAEQIGPSESTLPVTRIETISRGVIDLERVGYIDPADARDDRLLRSGDILFSNINSLNVIGNCAQYRLDTLLYAGMNLLVLRPGPRVNADWLIWLMKSTLFRGVVESFAKPAINQASIGQGALVSIMIVRPRYNEQTAIAAFLDRETSKIDDLIAEQEKLITLLAEKRQATISHAVTKGLNPDAPMKDSGVEWLGEIPAHWKATQLRHLCTLLKDGTHLPPPRVEDGVPLLSVRNIQANRFDLRSDDSMISERDYRDLCNAFVPQAGDVLMAIVGATLGKTAIIPQGLGEFHIQRSLAIFRTSPGISSKWLFYCFTSSGFQSLLWQYVGFSAQPGIYLATLSAFKLPIAPMAEQEAVILYLEAEMAKLDALSNEANRVIDLLKERRTALISAAVTGKIDVRDTVSASEAA